MSLSPLGLPIVQTYSERVSVLRFLQSESFIIRNPQNVGLTFPSTPGYPTYDYPCQFAADEPEQQYTLTIPTDAEYMQIRVPKGDAVWLSFAGLGQGLGEQNINASYPTGLASPPNTAVPKSIIYIDCFARDFISVLGLNTAIFQAVTQKPWVNACFFKAS